MTPDGPVSAPDFVVLEGGATTGLRRQLSSFGVLLLTLSCLSPVVSIFGIGGDVLKSVGAGAVWLFALGVVGAVIWAMVYAELGSAFPYSGGDYVGVGTILGGWAGVATLALWAVTAGPAAAFSAQTLAVYLAQLVPSAPVAFIPYAAVGAAVLVSLLSVRTSAWVTGAFLAIEMLAVVALVVAGGGHPAPGVAGLLMHPVTEGASGPVAVGFGSMALAMVSAVYATVGGNQAIYFGEELGDPHRRMGRVIMVACLLGAFAIAVPVVLVVVTAHDLPAILRSPAPFALFLSQALGPWAGPALSAGVALAIFNALIATIMAFSRLFFSLGRDRLFSGPINRLLASVHERSGAPRVATLVMGVFTGGCCLFSSHTLVVFFSGLMVYAWALVCLAVLVGRGKGLTAKPGYWRSPLFPAAPLAGLVLVAMFTAADLADPDAGRPSLLLLGVVVGCAIAWYALGLKKRPEGWMPSIAAE